MKMKAIVYQKYGSPDNLRYSEIEVPIPGQNEVLVKVHASSINSWDWDLLRGKPFLARLGGILKPQYKILGADVAGTVEDVGSQVTSWKVGDAVFGDISESRWGGFAQYVAIKADSLARKPENLTFEQSASIPQAGLLAWLGLQKGGWPIYEGKKVLVNGGGGGVGTFAIQIAKSFGAEVTAVDNTRKLEVMQNLGADHVIDYTRNDFTRSGNKYDLIVDVVAYRPLSQYRNALESNGSYVAIGGPHPLYFGLCLEPHY